MRPRFDATCQSPPMIEIVRLYVSREHNYFGHHGQPPGEEPALEMASVECAAGRGLRGDRFFDYKEDYKGQITFFAWDVYEDLCWLGSASISSRNISDEEIRFNLLKNAETCYCLGMGHARGSSLTSLEIAAGGRQ